MADKVTSHLTVENWFEIRTSAELKLATILNELIANVDYYGVDGFKRQLQEYAAGNRSSNIGDGMCVTLGTIRSVCEGNATLNELSDMKRRSRS